MGSPPKEDGWKPTLSPAVGLDSIPALTLLSGLVDSLVCLYEDARLQDSQHHTLPGGIQELSLDGDVQMGNFLLPLGGGWSLARRNDRSLSRLTDILPVFPYQKLRKSAQLPSISPWSWRQWDAQGVLG